MSSFKEDMNEINSSYSHFNTVSDVPKNPRHHWDSAYIKQVMHEKHIDEFFLTDFSAPPKRTSILATAGSLIGAIVPVIIFGKKQHPNLKIDSFKNLMKFIHIDYKLKELLSVGLGGLFGGLLGGLADRKEHYKLQKLEEGTFQLMNVIFPAVLVDQTMKLCKKHKALNNSAAKVVMTLGSIFVGASSAVGIANRVDKYIFDKYNHEPDRVFKKKDLLIHVDDLIGSLILAKIPFADKLHADKVLPLIYAWNGFHVGDS